MKQVWDYFQIASLAFFLIVLATRVVYLRWTKSINAIAVGRGKKGLSLVFELYAFAGLAVWMTEVLLRSVESSWRIFPASLDVQMFDSAAIKITGAVVVTTGFIILIWAFVSFGDSWRVGFDTKTPGRLVTAGVFAFSRNPTYLFLNLWFWGIFLLNGTLIFLIFAVVATLHLHYQILREEKFLIGLYGQAYQDYWARTGRYFRAGLS
jgi:protein-S-isoprenylcysteine O-methyltransferase Ste14